MQPEDPSSHGEAGPRDTLAAVQPGPLRQIDDETLLDMYDHAHETSDAHCYVIAAELHWRGIEVPPCNHAHDR